MKENRKTILFLMKEDGFLFFQGAKWEHMFVCLWPRSQAMV